MQKSPTIFAKATKATANILDGIWSGWVDMYRVAKYSSHDGKTMLVNPHGYVLGFWEGISEWWVETHILQPERDIARTLDSLFGNIEPSGHVDFDPLTYAERAGARYTKSGDYVIGTMGISDYSISYAGNAAGAWQWDNAHIQTSHPPNPIRRALIASLTGAKWTPYSSKQETKYYGYLTLMPNPAYLTQKTPSAN